ncbi:Multicopper oxidase [Liberibacter crescens BT-1]|uniref:Multicopper oxidase n=1 Tax=Liberibacter crescens (strain BT-1) TaxID=1215343 RepID=L0ET84_LIBCB|nr:multicopper oxidase family protein [Liberibacter crescens]AGA64162.1 Multicopper oxidase [Liberibacter crescens BT-1]
MYINRRKFIIGSTAAAIYGYLGKKKVQSSPLDYEPLKLETRIISALLTEKNHTQGIMVYGNNNIPPVIKMQRGKKFHARLYNGIGEPTTIHWHGLRIPNNMDGVPFLTQSYVYPNDVFDYTFIPPDGGTFWCHPHGNALTQMDRGLTAVVVVEDPKDPKFDEEIILNIRDWHLDKNAQFIEFNANKSNEYSSLEAIQLTNWKKEPQYDIPTNGFTRVRIVSTDTKRIIRLKLKGAQAKVIALDGYPIKEDFVLEHLMIAPGQRIDLAMLIPNEGDIAQLWDIGGKKPSKISSFRAIGSSLKRHLNDLGPLTPNQLPEPDLSSLKEISFTLASIEEKNLQNNNIGNSSRNSFWGRNENPWGNDLSPLAEMKIGKTYVLNIDNPTPQAHPLHLHGLLLKPIYSSIQQVKPYFSDTYLILPDEKVRLAVVADKLGDWVFHCDIIEQQKSGMSSYIRVA